jgi:putative oxidoreductase
MRTAIDKYASDYRDVALLIGRILIGILFLIAAYNKIRGYGGSVAYFGRLGLPAPGVVVPLVIIIELLVGVLIIAGYQTRLVALAIAVYVILAALIAHTNFADGNQLNHFLKNLAIAGGCLAMFLTGAGAHSADARQGR